MNVEVGFTAIIIFVFFSQILFIYIAILKNNVLLIYIGWDMTINFYKTIKPILESLTTLINILHNLLELISPLQSFLLKFIYKLFHFFGLYVQVRMTFTIQNCTVYLMFFNGFNNTKNFILFLLNVLYLLVQVRIFFKFRK